MTVYDRLSSSGEVTVISRYQGPRTVHISPLGGPLDGPNGRNGPNGPWVDENLNYECCEKYKSVTVTNIFSGPGTQLPGILIALKLIFFLINKLN